MWKDQAGWISTRYVQVLHIYLGTSWSNRHKSKDKNSRYGGIKTTFNIATTARRVWQNREYEAGHRKLNRNVAPNWIINCEMGSKEIKCVLRYNTNWTRIRKETLVIAYTWEKAVTKKADAFVAKKLDA